MLQSVQSLHSTVQYEHAQEIPKGRTNKIRGSEFSFCPFFPQEIHIFFLFSFVKQQHHVGYTLHALNYFGFYALLHSTIPGACFLSNECPGNTRSGDTSDIRGYILDAATDFQLYACLPVKFSNTAYVAHVRKSKSTQKEHCTCMHHHELHALPN